MKSISTDYLVIGAGASGMAFADVLVSESESTIVVVDRYHQPGGHWNRAYPFVRLHQPAALYGVNSRELGSGRIDRSGWNRGLYELASAAEICTYYDRVMQEHLLPSGRVRYFPLSEYTEDGVIHSMLADTAVKVKTRTVVDTTAFGVTVPNMRPPDYTVAQDVDATTPDRLPFSHSHSERFAVVGGGKTGVDVCLFLLANSVPPDRITWIVPRDSWFQNRAGFQPGREFAQLVFEMAAATTEASAEATSVNGLLKRLESCRRLFRLDHDILPTMYRGATVTEAEVEQLRTIPNIVRLGRVRRIEHDAIHLDHGEVPTSAATMHVDCTANGAPRRPVRPVFEGNKITIQPVRSVQPTFSSAFIAHVDVNYDDPSEKNRLCTPIPLPNSPIHFLENQLGDLLTRAKWSQDRNLRVWLRDSRLNTLYRKEAGPHAVDRKVAASRERTKRTTGPAIANLQRLLAVKNETANVAGVAVTESPYA